MLKFYNRFQNLYFIDESIPLLSIQILLGDELDSPFEVRKFVNSLEDLSEAPCKPFIILQVLSYGYLI